MCTDDFFGIETKKFRQKNWYPLRMYQIFSRYLSYTNTLFFKKGKYQMFLWCSPPTIFLIACSGNALLKAGKFFDIIPAENFCKYQRFNCLSSQVVYKIPKIPSAEILCANKLWMKNLNTAFDNFSENPKVFKDENHLRPMSILSLTSAAYLAVLGVFNFSQVVFPIVSSAICVKLSTVAQHLLLFFCNFSKFPLCTFSGWNDLERCCRGKSCREA